MRDITLLRRLRLLLFMPFLLIAYYALSVSRTQEVRAQSTFVEAEKPRLPAAQSIKFTFHLKSGPIPTESYERDIHGVGFIKLTFRESAKLSFEPYLTLYKGTLYSSGAPLNFQEKGSYDLGLYQETGKPKKDLFMRIRVVIERSSADLNKAAVLF